MNYLEVVGPTFLGNIPMLLAWLVGIVLAVRMLRRGGGKAEKLLLAGCSLMFVAQITTPSLAGLAIWLVSEQEMTMPSISAIFSLPPSIFSLAGIVCLILAFWTRWKTSAIK